MLDISVGALSYTSLQWLTLINWFDIRLLFVGQFIHMRW